MTFQQVNTPLETSISVSINSILNSFRYNCSNWIYIPGSDEDSYKKRREQDEFLLSTNTKRFMMLVVRKSKDKFDDVLPLYKVNALCFIDGDYEHDIIQTHSGGSNYIDPNLTDDGYWLHYSYVVFDFTASETKNSILVTNSDAVPTRGLFTLEITDTYNKKLGRLPFNSYIKFISIGSGIDTSTFSYPIYNQGISDGFMNVMRDIMTGEMIGYSTKNTPNCFTIEDDGGYPYTQMGYQNIIIPTGAIDIVTSDFSQDFIIDFKPLSGSIFNDELLSIKQKCIMMMTEDQIGLLKVKQNNITNNDIQTLASRRNCEISLIPCPKNGDIFIVVSANANWSLKANNLLVIESLSHVFDDGEDGEDGDILPPGSTPLVLPQTSKSISSDRPIDDGVINYIFNLYKLFFKHKEYCLTNENSYGGDIKFKIKEIEVPCFTQCDISKGKSTYDIELENWNGDTTHNIYIDLIV